MILTLLLLVQGPAPADTLPHWRGELGLGVDHHTRDRTDWSQERAALGRRWGTTTVQADLWNARRFGISDQGGGVELYLRPAPRLGVYLRGDAAPGAEVLPRSGVIVSATRGVGRGWEGTLHYRHMAYRTDGFDLYGGGVGRYRGRGTCGWMRRSFRTPEPPDPSSAWRRDDMDEVAIPTTSSKRGSTAGRRSCSSARGLHPTSGGPSRSPYGDSTSSAEGGGCGGASGGRMKREHRPDRASAWRSCDGGSNSSGGPPQRRTTSFPPSRPSSPRPGHSWAGSTSWSTTPGSGWTERSGA